MLGLSVGLACSILILLWVQDERSVDQHHRKIDRIYQVMEHQHYASNNIFTTVSTPGILAPALLEEIPEVEHATTYTWNVVNLFQVDEVKFKESGIYARSHLFEILTIPLIYGDKGAVLENPRSIVLSAGLAEKYFPGKNPVGQTIVLNQDQVHSVTGVFRNLPDRSTLQFDYILPMKDFIESNDWASDWGNNGPMTLLTLREGASEEAAEEKIRGFIKERNEGSVVELFLYPFGDRYLNGQFENGQTAGGRIEYVRIFSIIAIFVLLIACINFMNLSTARSSKRAKEVGIRKAIGAGRGSLIGQYIGESVLISVAALLLSILMVEAFLPVFNDLTGKTISIDYLQPELLLSFLGIALVTGLVAGSYPALYLSSFQAANVLKGTVKSSRGEVFARKGLVVFQFIMSVILIVSTIIIYSQVQYLQNRNLGFDRENLISFSVEGDLRTRWNTFRREVMEEPGVVNISRASHPILGRNSSTSSVEWPGKDPDATVLFESIRADHELIETLGFEMAEGRAFSREFAADTGRVILNEAAVEVMGLEDPVGQSARIWGADREIIGIIRDYNYQNLRYDVEPMFLILDGAFAYNGFLRVRSDDIVQTISGIEEVFSELNPDYPFDYQFMDDRYESLYRSETRLRDLAKYFGGFAIFISCLGLFGLSAFTAEQRTREIGIRKVLGASVRNLVLLLSRDFTRLVLIAILIALPFSWWLMSQWLNDYVYRIQIQWWMLAAAGMTAVTVAWITVGWQSVKAALINPADSLKSR